MEIQNPAAKQIAKHLRDIHFGGNWTVSNLKDNLANVSVEQATAQLGSFNTIATLTFHVNYFVVAALDVLQGKPLTSKDALSFTHPPLRDEEAWKNMQKKIFDDAEKLAKLIEKLPDEVLWQDFSDPKYGNYFRNLMGIIEHMHYHLGQIALLKKLSTTTSSN